MKYFKTILFAVSCVFTQEFDFRTDSLTVRAILDSNELEEVTVEEVSTVSGGRITQVTLINMGLTVLPAEIGNLSELEVLLMRDNDLTSLPDEIGALTKLRHLCIGNNNVLSLSDEIGNLGNLDTLHLTNNQLAGLPDSIIKLDHLTDLRLQDNKIGELTDELKEWADTFDPDWEDSQDPDPVTIGSTLKKRSPASHLQSINMTDKSIYTVFYLVNSNTPIQISVFKSKGGLVEILVDSYKHMDSYSVTWNVQSLGPGTYYLRLLSENYTSVKKVILLR